jgi:hypothetical protein
MAALCRRERENDLEVAVFSPVGLDLPRARDIRLLADPCGHNPRVCSIRTDGQWLDDRQANRQKGRRWQDETASSHRHPPWNAGC